MHVLVVDDLIVDRYILKKTLSPFFQVTTLSSANEAISFALGNSFQIALLNVLLKEDMDGLLLLSRLKRVSITPFSALAISSPIDEGRYQKLIGNGFMEVLNKPFDVSEFMRLVQYEKYSTGSVPISR